LTPRRKAPYHIAKVRKNLTREVLHALTLAQRQTSGRQLAREAGISNVLLIQLSRGDFQVTPAVAKKLADVFDRWGAQYAKLARTIRAAARKVPTLRTGRTS
jgi:transcriptional regulator with XRE-family HTH domain